MSAQGILLEVRNVNRAFGGVLAVCDFSFDVRRGQLKAIIGPNGAGKTTLFNLISGIYPCSGGEIVFKGKPINNYKPHMISKRGIARTFQVPKLFSNMTVLENVMVGRHTRTRAEILDAAIPLRKTKAEEDGIRHNAEQWLKFFGLEGRSENLAETIPFGERRILEIARALAAEPELLLLDEPAAGLNDKEREWLAKLLRDIRNMGITILWVEHVVHMVMSIADEIVVMDWGKKICEGSPEHVQCDDKVIEAYLGVGNA
jgi:branched-chain amino acid transport system ATP-binding protein